MTFLGETTLSRREQHARTRPLLLLGIEEQAVVGMVPCIYGSLYSSHGMNSNVKLVSPFQKSFVVASAAQLDDKDIEW